MNNKPDLATAILAVPCVLQEAWPMPKRLAYIDGHNEALKAAAALVGAPAAATGEPAELPKLPEPMGELHFRRPQGFLGRLNGYSAVQLREFGAQQREAGRREGIVQGYAEIEPSRKRLSERLDLAEQQLGGETWVWEGGGADNLESMSNGMTVVIRADQLRALATRQPVGELTDERAAFEAWVSRGGANAGNESMWDVWQARARLAPASAEPTGDQLRAIVREALAGYRAGAKSAASVAPVCPRAEPWNDEQREQYRAHLKQGERCDICSVVLGGQHFPTCSREGT